MSPGPQQSDNISTGELGRRLDTVLEEQRAFRGEVTTKFEALGSTFVRTEVHALETAAVKERLAKVENNLAWVGRTIGGSVAVAIIGGLLAAAKIGGVG